MEIKGKWEDFLADVITETLDRIGEFAQEDAIVSANLTITAASVMIAHVLATTIPQGSISNVVRYIGKDISIRTYGMQDSSQQTEH